jgi:hypothetical protein
LSFDRALLDVVAVRMLEVQAYVQASAMTVLERVSSAVARSTRS